MDYFVGLFGISELVNVQVRTLSLGERMKMELIVALLHNPGVLFLDEPTIGLDAAAQRQMRAFLREVNAKNGTTIILTSFLFGTIFMNSFQFFMGIWAFKISDTIFLTHVPPMIISFFTGELVPLSLLPGAMAEVLRFLPFTHVVYTPTMLLAGGMDIAGGLAGLAALVVWAAGMAIVSHYAYGRLRRKHEAVGI